MSANITTPDWNAIGDIHTGMNWSDPELFELNELAVDNLRLVTDGIRGEFYSCPCWTPSREDFESLLNIAHDFVTIIDFLRDPEQVELWYQRREKYYSSEQTPKEAEG